MFVIGKTQKPHCFRNKTFIYRHKKAEWGTVWRLSARIDRIFSPEEKSVTLAIDNCPAHARIENLKSNCFS